MLDLQSVYFGRKHLDFDYKDMELIKKIKRLAQQHRRQCENSCNGYGRVKGQIYYTGAIDDYARREYGADVKDGCIGEDDNIFDQESGRIQEVIYRLLSNINLDKYSLWLVKPFKVEFQGDPRGATVKLYYEGEFILL